MEPHLTTILVPVYNEHALVETTLRRVVASPVAREIVVVDDGSVDGTTALLQRLQPELGFRLLRHERNEGKGRAIVTGLAHARGDFILIQDADLEYDPEDYGALLKPLETGRADVVYGSRFLGPHRASYFWHRLGNWIVTTFVNVLFNSSLTDVETGYKVFRRELMQGIRLRSKGFEFEIEITCKLLRAGRTIFEVPISYYGRTYAEGKKITWRDGLVALGMTLWYRLNPWA